MGEDVSVFCATSGQIEIVISASPAKHRMANSSISYCTISCRRYFFLLIQELGGLTIIAHPATSRTHSSPMMICGAPIDIRVIITVSRY
jgi:hypothetical protein